MQQFDKQGFPLLDINGYLLSWFQPVKISGGRQDGNVAVFITKILKIIKNLRVHQRREKIVLVGFSTKFATERTHALLQIDFFGGGPRSASQRFSSSKNDFLDGLWPTAFGLPEISREKIDDRFGKTGLGGKVYKILGLDSLGNEKDRKIPHALAARSHLDDVSQHLVYLAVGFDDVRPSFPQTKGRGLFAQIRILPSGHLVIKDFGTAKRRRTVKGA